MAPAVRPLWLGSGALVLAAHGAGLMLLLLAGARLPQPPPPEPVVLVELPPLPAPAPAVANAAPQADQRPDPVAAPPLAPRITAPPVNAPLPREPVAVPPPVQSPPQRAATPPAAAPAAAQAAPAAPAGTGAAAGDDPRAAQQEADYRALVRSHIGRNRFSPPQSRRAGLSGDIGVHFTVNRDGQIADVGVARSSGHALLDGEAVEFIRRLARVPAFPRDLRRAEIPLTITLRFSLERR